MTLHAWTPPAPVAVLDGGVGHALKTARGDAAFLGGALLAAEEPEEVVRVHTAFIGAGAQLATAASFGVTPRSLAAAGLPDSDLERLVTACVKAARRAADAASPRAGVAAPLPPLGECYKAGGAGDADKAVQINARIARAALAAGADILLAETLTGSTDAVAALRGAAAAGAAGDRVWLSWTVADSDGAVTRGGERLEAAAAAAVAATAGGPPPAVLAVNCSSLAAVEAGVRALAPVAAASGARVGAYGNAFVSTTEAHLEGGGSSEPPPDAPLPPVVPPAAFGEAATRWLRAGATLAGGCCGAGPEHVAAVRDAVAECWGGRGAQA